MTLNEVDEFLASPVARHYYTFGDSNVKRRLIRMLFFLRAEVDRLQRLSGTQASDTPQWTQRVSNKR